MSKPLHELTFTEYNDLLKSGMMYVYYPECTGIYNNDCISPEEKRMDIIGQNGATGEHYGEEE